MPLTYYFLHDFQEDNPLSHIPAGLTANEATCVDGQVTQLWGPLLEPHHSKPPLRPKSSELIVPRVPGLGSPSIESRLLLAGTDPSTVPRSGRTIPPTRWCFLSGADGGRSNSPEPGLPGTPRPCSVFRDTVVVAFITLESEVSVAVDIQELVDGTIPGDAIALLRLVNCAIGLFRVRRV